MVSGSRQHRYKTLDRPVPHAATALTTDHQTAENRRHSESLITCLLACLQGSNSSRWRVFPAFCWFFSWLLPVVSACSARHRRVSCVVVVVFVVVVGGGGGGGGSGGILIATYVSALCQLPPEECCCCWYRWCWCWCGLDLVRNRTYLSGLNAT